MRGAEKARNSGNKGLVSESMRSDDNILPEKLEMSTDRPRLSYRSGISGDMVSEARMSFFF